MQEIFMRHEARVTVTILCDVVQHGRTFIVLALSLPAYDSQVE
jgi:hypothetical protein